MTPYAEKGGRCGQSCVERCYGTCEPGRVREWSGMDVRGTLGGNLGSSNRRDKAPTYLQISSLSLEFNSI